MSCTVYTYNKCDVLVLIKEHHVEYMKWKKKKKKMQVEQKKWKV